MQVWIMSLGHARGLLSLVLIVAIVAAPGCSAFKADHVPLGVIPSDERAQVYIDGKPVGRGSLVVPVKRNKSHIVMAKVGDRAGTVEVQRKISESGMWDIVGGVLFLVPFIGLLTPGFWDLQPDTVTVAVPPAPVAQQVQ